MSKKFDGALQVLKIDQCDQDDLTALMNEQAAPAI
jgi:hypothetical protein